MNELNLVYSDFDPEEVDKNYNKKQEPLNGESFIIDWSLPEYENYKKAFETLSNMFHVLFKGIFIPQMNHHSTILSKRLDEKEIDDPTEIKEWLDNDFSETSKIIYPEIPNFKLTLKLIVLAREGNFQLVLRAENIIEKCVNKKNKTIRTVIVRSFNYSMDCEVWLITHFGVTTKKR
jgi:hypothetical protein